MNEHNEMETATEQRVDGMEQKIEAAEIVGSIIDEMVITVVNGMAGIVAMSGEHY
jgi:hypothetical protein